MDEKELELRLVQLREDWRVPRDPPLNAMWSEIEARAFPAQPVRSPSRWRRNLLPLAATLVLGFGLGQLSPALLGGPWAPAASTAGSAGALAGSDVATQRVSVSDVLFVGVATDYLERVIALLVSLAEANRRGAPLEYSPNQARDLLATTRLLMDSPQPQSAALRELLDDLELVLAQMVRLPGRATPPDVYLIDQAIDQREVLPRLRGLLAENTISQP